MTYNATIAAALTVLATTVAVLCSASAMPKVYNPFKSNDPFDISTRSGSLAYAQVSSQLDTVWNGDVSSFTSFMVSLRVRAREGKWGKAGDEGILELGGKNILTKYHSITDADIEATRVTRTNNRAIQNCKAMYNCIKSSITGDIKDTIFTQFDNLPADEDGIQLFKTLTTFITVASFKLSLLSFNNIIHFSPVDLDFNIFVINTKLIHLFVLAMTATRDILDFERIQHTLTVYTKILQPETRA